MLLECRKIMQTIYCWWIKGEQSAFKQLSSLEKRPLWKASHWNIYRALPMIQLWAQFCVKKKKLLPNLNKMSMIMHYFSASWTSSWSAPDRKIPVANNVVFQKVVNKWFSQMPTFCGKLSFLHKKSKYSRYKFNTDRAFYLFSKETFSRQYKKIWPSTYGGFHSKIQALDFKI